VFSAVDSDCSGTIDLSELSVAVTASAGRPVKEKEVRKILEKWDTNGDGVLGGLERAAAPRLRPFRC
jgi:Ca2+-binding EF-hand superfamily protein